MAHFRGTIQGGRGSASRLGHKSTGMIVQANGWSFGVTVNLRHNEQTGQDEADIELTGESGKTAWKPLGTFTEKDLMKGEKS